MSKRLSIVLLFILLLSTLPVFAQDGGWFLYNLDTLNKQLIRIHQDGSSERIDLNISENAFLGSSDIVISPDGSRVSFCEMIVNDTGEMSGTVYVYDIETGANLLGVPYGRLGGCRVTAFNADGTQIAVSIVIPNMPSMDGSNTVNGQPIWRTSGACAKWSNSP